MYEQVWDTGQGAWQDVPARRLRVEGFSQIYNYFGEQGFGFVARGQLAARMTVASGPPQQAVAEPGLDKPCPASGHWRDTCVGEHDAPPRSAGAGLPYSASSPGERSDRDRPHGRGFFKGTGASRAFDPLDLGDPAGPDCGPCGERGGACAPDCRTVARREYAADGRPGGRAAGWPRPTATVAPWRAALDNRGFRHTSPRLDACGARWDPRLT